jgi:hypothetical protein
MRTGVTIFCTAASTVCVLLIRNFEKFEAERHMYFCSSTHKWISIRWDIIYTLAAITIGLRGDRMFERANRRKRPPKERGSNYR